MISILIQTKIINSCFDLVKIQLIVLLGMSSSLVQNLYEVVKHSEDYLDKNHGIL